MKSTALKAVIFDLDGVITRTAEVHSKAWKQLFDDYLKSREKRFGEPFREFTHENDYLPYVDGKPRYEGVRDFLLSRNIKIPFGHPDDSPDKESCCGLGNRKNIVFNEILKTNGVGVFQSTLDLIYQLKKNGIRVGVASSSKNCKNVLEAAGIIDLFECRVDGVVSAELGLKGKPESDIFVTAARQLNASPYNTVVVEDAVSGVQAGKKGNFGLVLGIARENNKEELLAHGADWVVSDLSEVTLDNLVQWFEHGLKDDGWQLKYTGFDPDKEKSRESLLAIGNGYLGSRGNLEEFHAGTSHYPGTYIAGLYNRLKSNVAGREVENDDFVNCPNWTWTEFTDEEHLSSSNSFTIEWLERKIDFRTGLLEKSMIVGYDNGKKIRVRSQRFVSMYKPHLTGMHYEITPLNFSGKISVVTGIDANIINDGVERYRDLNQKHIECQEASAQENELSVLVKTTSSDIRVAEMARITPAQRNLLSRKTGTGVNKAFSSITWELKKGEVASFDKIVSIYTSKHDDVDDPLTHAQLELGHAGSFEEELKLSAREWEKIWKEIDIEIEGDRLSQKLLRLHLYHMMVSASPHNKNLDVSFTARGLHGEAYRGHIFWDEMFIMPFYNLHFPEVSRACLMYRYRRLDAAREYARQYGYKGAMFPWQSSSDGREETQTMHLNPVTRQWGPDHSSLQRHVSLAIAKNIIDYYEATDDHSFMEEAGYEMLLEIARFWISRCEWNTRYNRYSIRKVMGPDEFHEKYPGSDEGGLDDNAYTNIMVAWLVKKLSFLIPSSSEIQEWLNIVRQLNLVVNEDGVIAQFDGYFELEELDWDYYRKKYGNIYRMDRLLKAEGKSPENFKVSKQADTLQVFYNLSLEEVDDILKMMGYQLPKDYVKKNLEYYLSRTSHGSTLSRLVHAWIALLANDYQLSWQLYSEALQSDYTDIQGGTTAEGIHFGLMAGTVYLVFKAFAGIKMKKHVISFHPHLPSDWVKIYSRLRWKGNLVDFKITPEYLALTLLEGNDLQVETNAGKYTLSKSEKLKIK